MWQAARWRSEVEFRTSPSFGILVLQTSSTNAQRVWNRHPEGGLTGLGGSPASGAASTLAAGSMLRRQASKA